MNEWIDTHNDTLGEDEMIWYISIAIYLQIYLYYNVQIYLYYNVSPDVILCGWLGLKHQLTN